MTVFFEHALKRTLRQRMLLAALAIFPLALALAPQPLADVPPIGFSLYGLLIIFTAFLLTRQILDDRSHKTIIRIAAAPIDHKQYLIGHLTAYLVIMVIQNILFMLMAMIIWQDIGVNYGMVFLNYIALSTMALTFSLFWHLLFKSYATSVAVFSVIVNIFALLGGLVIPLSLMPENIRNISIVLPTYWFSHGLQALFDKSYVSFFLSLSIVLGFAIIFLVIGSKRRLE